MFTVITVVNSVMMITGWDTPKTGTFAYTHLLSRLAIVAAVVSLFHLDELHEHIERRRDRDRRPLTASGGGSSAIELITRQLPRSPSSRVAVAFTVVTAVLCVATIASSVWREPSGGVALYRAVLVLAATTAVLVGVETRWSR